MRLEVITNWAYGITVALTIVSGTAMLCASSAQREERTARETRHDLEQANHVLTDEVYMLTNRAREYVSTGDPAYLTMYRAELENLKPAEDRLGSTAAKGTTADERRILTEAFNLADALQDEQAEAISAYQEGDVNEARQWLFGPEYERELDRLRAVAERFADNVDQRTRELVRDTERTARFWRIISEIAVGVTALLFLCVLYFVFKRRVLHPVVKLSDVLRRMTRQDYSSQPLEIPQIDEIGDMAHAVTLFRENALERQRLEQERDRDRTSRELISRMTQRMQGSDNVADVVDIIRRFVPRVAMGLAGRLYLLDRNRNVMVETCQWEGPKYSTHEFSTLACWALRRGMPHHPSSENVDVPCPHLDIAEGETPDTICLPLIGQREVIGLLYLEGLEDLSDDCAQQGHLLAMLAENIGLALANLKLREDLREMAMADSLTGLANRRQLDLVLQKQLGRGGHNDEPISVLMADVDHFKRINDTFGHDAGDAVLREVGAVLRDATRKSDLSFRYGGEEFLMMLPGTDLPTAIERAEEVRTRIEDLTLSFNGHSLGSISISIGIANSPLHSSFEGLVPLADTALLRAKSLGRNRVEIAENRRTRRTGSAA